VASVAVCAVNCTADGRTCCSHCSSHRSIASYSLTIAICAAPHLQSTTPLGGTGGIFPCRLVLKNYGLAISNGEKNEGTAHGPDDAAADPHATKTSDVQFERNKICWFFLCDMLFTEINAAAAVYSF